MLSHLPNKNYITLSKKPSNGKIIIASNLYSKFNSHGVGIYYLGSQKAKLNNSSKRYHNHRVSLWGDDKNYGG